MCCIHSHLILSVYKRASLFIMYADAIVGMSVTEVTTSEGADATSVCVDITIQGNLELELVVSLQVIDGRASKCPFLVQSNNSRA